MTYYPRQEVAVVQTSYLLFHNWLVFYEKNGQTPLPPQCLNWLNIAPTPDGRWGATQSAGEGMQMAFCAVGA